MIFYGLDAIFLELTIADPEGCLCEIGKAGIEISHIQKPSELVLVFSISRKHYEKIMLICDQRGGKLKILKRMGMCWIVKKMWNRPVVLLGFAFMLAVCLYLPTRVLFINVQGNSTVPTKQILSAATECGIHFGSSRKAVRNEKLKNALLSCLPQLEWVGINTAGCTASISVRERSELGETEKSGAVSSIVAARDGYITSVTVVSGNAVCIPGQYVKKGQVLISGYTDCGIFIQAAEAEGEVYAQTIRDLRVVTPMQTRVRSIKEKTSRKYSLIIGKKRINLWKGSGISDATCGRIYEEIFWTLPGGFRMPITFCMEECISYSIQRSPKEKGQLMASLSAAADCYLREQMIGGTILMKEEDVTSNGQFVILEGSYTCEEMIGKVQQEQIGE